MTFKPAQNIITIFLVLVFISSSILPSTLNVYAQSVDDYQKELEEKQKEKEEKESYLASVKKEIERIQNSGYSLDYQIQLIEEELEKVKTEMDRLLKELEEKEIYIAEKEVEIGKKQDKVNEISDKLYRNSRISALDILLRKEGAENVIQSLIFNKFVIASQVAYMKRLAVEMDGLKLEKEKLGVDKVNYEKDQEDFNESKAILAEQKVLLQKQLSAQVNTKGALSKQIGVLNEQISKLQEAILVAKSGQAIVPIDSVPSSGDIYATLSGFRSNAPAGSFAVFSIGAYTHRNGMSQWGAKARAEAGQSYTDILSAYYPGKTLQSNQVNIGGNVENILGSISVTGFGTLSFEDYYLLGIKEVPESWPIEVLKAQAIAARTFAVRHTSNGRSSICTTEACQVFGTPLKSGAWKDAVLATRGMILVNSDGTPASTQYAAVHGGWVNGVGWDTTDRTNSGNWMARAWDSISGVNWFYKAWYRVGYSDTSANCGRYSWLNNEEFSDILNAWLAKREGVGVDESRIIPITINSCPFAGSSGGNPYSMAQLRALLPNPVTSVTGSPIVAQSNQGSSITVNVPTNRGILSIPAEDFKAIFNLRAPGYLSIPQFGFTFYNIESK